MLIPMELPFGSPLPLSKATMMATWLRQFLFDGGPGVSSLSTTLPLLAGEYGQPILAGGRDLIMVEQRGNFFSEPHLTCPEVSEAFRQTTLQELNFEEEAAPCSLMAIGHAGSD